MESNLPLFTKIEKGEYAVEVQKEQMSYGGDLKDSYEVTVVRLNELRGGQKLEIFALDTSRLDTWGWGVLEGIIETITPYLNDFTGYHWKEIRQPILDYWLLEQDRESARQKQAGVKWKPGGDYTLWVLSEFIAQVFIVKFVLIGENFTIPTQETNANYFEGILDELVGLPVHTYSKINQLIVEGERNSLQSKQVIDLLVSYSRKSGGLNEDILDPKFKDSLRLLSDEEDEQLAALWEVMHEQEGKLKAEGVLSDSEKRIKMKVFWHSPQGKRLKELNSRLVHGGSLAFEEKETRKSKRVLELVEMLNDIFDSWGFSVSDTEIAIHHYRTLVEKHAFSRWEEHKRWEDLIMDLNRKDELSLKDLQGIWDENSLQLLGIILGIAVGIGFGFASLVENSQVLALLVGGVTGTLSIAVLVGLMKIKYVKRQILRFSRWALS